MPITSTTVLPEDFSAEASNENVITSLCKSGGSLRGETKGPASLWKSKKTFLTKPQMRPVLVTVDSVLGLAWDT